MTAMILYYFFLFVTIFWTTNVERNGTITATATVKDLKLLTYDPLTDIPRLKKIKTHFLN